MRRVGSGSQGSLHKHRSANTFLCACVCLGLVPGGQQAGRDVTTLAKLQKHDGSKNI